MKMCPLSCLICGASTWPCSNACFLLFCATPKYTLSSFLAFGRTSYRISFKRCCRPEPCTKHFTNHRFVGCLISFCSFTWREGGEPQIDKCCTGVIGTYTKKCRSARCSNITVIHGQISNVALRNERRELPSCTLQQMCRRAQELASSLALKARVGDSRKLLLLPRQDKEDEAENDPNFVVINEESTAMNKACNCTKRIASTRGYRSCCNYIFLHPAYSHITSKLHTYVYTYTYIYIYVCVSHQSRGRNSCCP